MIFAYFRSQPCSTLKYSELAKNSLVVCFAECSAYLININDEKLLCKQSLPFCKLFFMCEERNPSSFHPQNDDKDRTSRKIFVSNNFPFSSTFWHMFMCLKMLPGVGLVCDVDESAHFMNNPTNFLDASSMKIKQICFSFSLTKRLQVKPLPVSEIKWMREIRSKNMYPYSFYLDWDDLRESGIHFFSWFVRW